MQFPAEARQESSGLSEKAESYISRFAKLAEKFDEAMDDDFNTAQALGYVFEMVRLTNNFIVEEKKMPAPEKAAILEEAQKVFDRFGEVLGVFHGDPDSFFMADQETELRKRGLKIDAIEDLVRQRQAARQNKDWSRADELRKELAAMNIVLKDSPAGTTWTVE